MIPRKIPKNTYKCELSWDDLKGDENVRFCEVCQNKVYDLRGLNELEVIQFIELENGEVCGLAHYDSDGRIVNGECKQPVETSKYMTMGKLRVPPPAQRIKDKIKKTQLEIDEAQERIKQLKRLQILVEENHDSDANKLSDPSEMMRELFKKELDLSNAKLDELEILNYLVNTVVLNLSQSEITNLSALGARKKLRELYLDNTQVTDLTPLKKLKNLRQLSLEDTPITLKQINELQECLPKCKIKHDFEKF